MPSTNLHNNASWTLDWNCISGCSNDATLSSDGPGARADATHWLFGTESPSLTTNEPVTNSSTPSEIDGTPNIRSLFMYGGYGPGYDLTIGASRGYYNDVWRYDVPTREWTRVHGNSEPFLSGEGIWTFSRQSTQTHRKSIPTMAEANQAKETDGELVIEEEEANSEPRPSPVLALSPLAGASALVRQRTTDGKFPATILIVGGQRFGIGSNTTFFLDAERFNASSVVPTNAPRTRIGALTYTYYGIVALYYGGFTNGQISPYCDLFALNWFTGTWNYICDSAFCAENTDISWCQTCLALMPTTDYVNGLKFANALTVNTTKGYSRVVIGGQRRANRFDWEPAPWTRIRGAELDRPTLPTSSCVQSNPAPQVPELFQCVDGAWETSAVCADCPIQLNLTYGAPVQVLLGNWSPEALSLFVQPGSLLNITGSLSTLNLTAEMYLDDELFRDLAIHTTGHLSIVESSTLNVPSLSDGAPQINALGRSYVDGCTTKTFFASSWSTGRTITGRKTVDIIMNWKSVTTPGCEAPTAVKKPNIALIASMAVLGALLLGSLVLIAVFYKRIQSFAAGFRRKDTQETEMATQPPVDPESARSSVTLTSSGQHLIRTRASSSQICCSANAVYQGGTASVISPETPMGLESSNGTAAANSTKVVSPTTSQKVAPAKQPIHSRDSVIIGYTPRSGVSRSDLDYESGLGSLETSVHNEEFEVEDDAFIPDLSLV